MKTRTTYVVGGVRIPFMKSMTAYRDVTTPELMTEQLNPHDPLHFLKLLYKLQRLRVDAESSPRGLRTIWKNVP